MKGGALSLQQMYNHQYKLTLLLILRYFIFMNKFGTLSQTKKSLPTRGMQTSTSIWTQEKSERDSQLWGNTTKLWIVQNKVYDLSTFSSQHPGGRHWIELTKGQDITEHFITHHLDQKKARDVLEKYYVNEAEKPQKQRFTFQEEGLYRKIKRGLLAKYKKEELQNWSQSVIDGAILLTIWFILFILSSFYQSYILAFLCGLSIYPLLGVAHNFIHMKYHPFRYLWMLTGFTHSEWQQMHCLSHHAYPNTLLDYEIQALQPVVYYLKIMPKNTILKGLIKELVFPFTTLFNILLKIVIVPIFKRKMPEWFYLTPLLQIPFIYLLTGDLEMALKLFAIMHIAASFIFMKLTFLGHRTGREWTEGNEQIRDFAEHQIFASTDTNVNGVCGLLSYIYYAGFNYHAIHHIFPTIDNHSLPVADKILTEEAKRVGISKNIQPSILKGLFQIESNFFNRKQWHRQ